MMSIDIILAISDKPISITDISKKINCTFSHCSKIINFMKRNGMVSYKLSGRCKMIELTDKGKKFREAFLRIGNDITIFKKTLRK